MQQYAELFMLTIACHLQPQNTSKKSPRSWRRAARSSLPVLVSGKFRAVSQRPDPRLLLYDLAIQNGHRGSSRHRSEGPPGKSTGGRCPHWRTSTDRGCASVVGPPSRLEAPPALALGPTRAATPAPQALAVLAGEAPQASPARDAGLEAGGNPLAGAGRDESVEPGKFTSYRRLRCRTSSNHGCTSVAGPSSWPATPMPSPPATPASSRGKRASTSRVGGQENADPRASLGYGDEEAGPGELAVDLY